MVLGVVVLWSCGHVVLWCCDADVLVILLRCRGDAVSGVSGVSDVSDVSDGWGVVVVVCCVRVSVVVSQLITMQICRRVKTKKT